MNITTLATAFALTVHPSPLVAEYYTLGDAHVIRLVGEGGFSVDHPKMRSTLVFSSKGDAFAAAAAWVKNDIDTGFRVQQDEPQEDQVDIEVSDQGSITLVKPKTDLARTWIDEHVVGDTQWFNGALVVEWRYLDHLLAGMEGDGLRCA